MQAQTAFLSKPGGRKANQDAYEFECDEAGGCWAVADGLGGHAGGEVASRVAGEAAVRQLRKPGGFSREGLAACMAFAHQAVRAKAEEDPVLAGMRTTLVVLACSGDRALWGHVGDSRLYWFRQGKILHQTRDHSVPQMLVDAGKIKPEAIRGHEDQNRLTRALGQEGEIRPELLQSPLDCQDGDAALLCSDGVWTWVLEAEMEHDLQSTGSPDEWLAALERRVLARAAGPYDNYTALAVSFSRSKQE